MGQSLLLSLKYLFAGGWGVRTVYEITQEDISELLYIPLHFLVAFSHFPLSSLRSAIPDLRLLSSSSGNKRMAVSLQTLLLQH